MNCPIRFVRKPEDSECIREKCSFWVKADSLASEAEEPERFSAVLTGPDTRAHAKQAAIEGKCAILVIAEKTASHYE